MANSQRWNEETGRWEEVTPEDARQRENDVQTESDTQYDPRQSDSRNYEREDRSSNQEVGIHFLNGNRNTPALFLGDDPSNKDVEGQDNVLVVPLGAAQSVPRLSVSETEGTPGLESEETEESANRYADQN